MTSHELDSFQLNLLSDLRQHVATRPLMTTPDATPINKPAASRGTRGRKAVLIVGLAAACTATAVIVPTLGAQPAYAVSSDGSGVVHVKINRLEDAAKLESDLKRHGINADVQYLPVDTECAADRFVEAHSAVDSATAFTTGSTGVDAVIDRRDVPRDVSVVISASRMSTHSGFNVEVGIAKGFVAPCKIIPVPKEMSQ